MHEAAVQEDGHDEAPRLRQIPGLPEQSRKRQRCAHPYKGLSVNSSEIEQTEESAARRPAPTLADRPEKACAVEQAAQAEDSVGCR